MFDTEKDTQLNSSTDASSQDAIIPESQPKQVEPVDYRDLFLRVTADFQNFQRRVEKQKSEWMLIGQESIILKLLPVMQDLERALDAAFIQGQDKSESWADGLKVIHKNLLKVFTDLDIQEIKAEGVFNPEMHEAIAQVESPNHSSEQIVDVVSKGYLFKGKVIRFAQVTVAK
jgi:molecular chaperone GrpE